MPRPIIWLTMLTPVVALFLFFPPPIHLLKSAARIPVSWSTGQKLDLTGSRGTGQEASRVGDHGVRPYTRRIVAVGDLHGDMPNAQKVLHMAGVVDANGDWSGEVDYFVQTGDIIDRWVLSTRAMLVENSSFCERVEVTTPSSSTCGWTCSGSRPRKRAVMS